MSDFRNGLYPAGLGKNWTLKWSINPLLLKDPEVNQVSSFM
jgi:hypothetical protein